VKVNIEKKDINQLIHDTRSPLNRISMQAELIKMVLENDMPKEKALTAVNKIIVACQDCSQSLQEITEFLQQ
jgi:signal transduction histidine kinase